MPSFARQFSTKYPSYEVVVYTTVSVTHNMPLTTCSREVTTKSVLNYYLISTISTVNSVDILSSLHHILPIKSLHTLHLCTKWRKWMTDLIPCHRGQHVLGCTNKEQSCKRSLLLTHVSLKYLKSVLYKQKVLTKNRSICQA